MVYTVVLRFTKEGWCKIDLLMLSTVVILIGQWHTCADHYRHHVKSIGSGYCLAATIDLQSLCV